MKKSFIVAIIVVLTFGALCTGLRSVQAQSANDDIGKNLYAAGGTGGAGFAEPLDPRYSAAILIRSLLGLLGTIIFGYYVYAGFLWTTAGGNDEQVAKAKNTIKNATIGLILVMMSYSITLAAVDVATGWPIGTSGGPIGFFRSLIGGL